MKTTLGKFLLLLMVTSLILGAPTVIKESGGEPSTRIEVINPLDGTNLFNFTTEDIHAGENFTIEVWGYEFTGAFTWQVKLSWDPTILSCAEVVIPEDSPWKFDVTPGTVINNEEGWFATGYSSLGPTHDIAEGIMVRVTMTVLQEPNKTVTMLSSALSLGELGTDTYVLDADMSTIPATLIDGTFEYHFIIARPYLEVVPRFYEAKKLGEDVAIDVYIRNLDPAWELVAVQFCLLYNYTLLNATQEYDEGGFLEAFVNGGEQGVLYTIKCDFAWNPPQPPFEPPPPGYNYYAVGIIIMPNSSGEWEAPFPEGEGKLITLHFTAILETVPPVEAYTDLTLFNIILLDKNLMEIPYRDPINGRYKAPVKPIGLIIDLYTQYPKPFGGQGPNNPSDCFGPTDLVQLNASVTYNGYPVQSVLVAYEIRHNDYQFTLTGETNSEGIATVTFRPPWPCENPEEEIFGEWSVIATVCYAGIVKNDTLNFIVYWPVEVVSVKAIGAPYEKVKTGEPTAMVFEVTVGTYRMYPLNDTVITVTVYDELAFGIGFDLYTSTLGWGGYGHYGEFKTYNYTFTIMMPSHACVGKATVYGNAYSALPWEGGVAYCPAATEEFYIVIPE